MTRLRVSSPPEMATRRASKADAKNWNRYTRDYRSCYHCRTLYLTAADATACEDIHTGNDARSPAA
ncbi:hypothetical protein CFN78_19970 [Amycolatopsis antarctica]|uniref:Uncharacterized protein n=1 Tax=Amycolatopsis antarctica TaxID=1854586 RepID=A0A263CZ97_9PSEU|nr:hypothetical protein CFN78_19970 [Amycolatopsis antarctica]